MVLLGSAAVELELVMCSVLLLAMSALSKQNCKSVKQVLIELSCINGKVEACISIARFQVPLILFPS